MRRLQTGDIHSFSKCSSCNGDLVYMVDKLGTAAVLCMDCTNPVDAIVVKDWIKEGTASSLVERPAAPQGVTEKLWNKLLAQRTSGGSDEAASHSVTTKSSEDAVVAHTNRPRDPTSQRFVMRDGERPERSPPALKSFSKAAAKVSGIVFMRVFVVN